MSEFLVTITPPTPNGDLHIGHIAGPFLAADVFTRAQRQRGHGCVLVSYSDDYQSYMLRRGLELGADPRHLAGLNTKRILRSLASVDIDVDNWMRAQDNAFFKTEVTRLFEAGVAKGVITEKETLEPWCPSCDVWGYEAFGRGECNYCGHDSDASQCEACAQAPDAAEMKGFHCKLCGGAHEWKPVKRQFLDLARFKGHLRELFRGMPLRRPMDGWVPAAIETLHDWGVTRPGDAGLDLAVDGSCRIHTWFMGLAGYLAALREYEAVENRPGLADALLGNPDARIVHFLGYDCAFSHMLVYPALLSLLDDHRIQPRFVPNQFLKLDGLNLSTSRGHAIWVADFAARVEPDCIRLYLASIAPEEEEGDFRSDVFEVWRKAVFTDFIPALLAAGSATGGVVAPQDLAALEGLKRRLAVASELDGFSMREIAAVVLEAVELARVRLAEGGDVRPLAAFLAGATVPLTPDLGERIAAAFGFDPATLLTAIGVTLPAATEVVP